jgi:hypothetical protein
MGKKPDPNGETYKKREISALRYYFGDEIAPCEYCGNPTHNRYRCMWCDETGMVQIR